jgi:hypothetical protein
MIVGGNEAYADRSEMEIASNVPIVHRFVAKKRILQIGLY